ncbi:MAG: FAD/NAD(P)-binding protein [Gammaproteobacteria bacterium]|nr:FAD/NAD(P)-binding protein [Gammaproteobacteria bacterium]
MKVIDKTFQWAVIGAGPAGIAAVGELLDLGVDSKQVLWVDPYFEVGDFGRHWGEVSSNTRVKLFLKFLKGCQAFGFDDRSRPFAIEQLSPDGFCQLKFVAEPLRWVTQQLREKVTSCPAKVNSMMMSDSVWNLKTDDTVLKVRKVIMATGCNPKSLPAHEGVRPINLYEALDPSKLATVCDQNDAVAVFGSSHSSMIIIRNLNELGVKRIINLYLQPVRYAVHMDGWTLYDNTGLKAETAAWTRDNVVRNCLPHIERYISNPENIEKYMPQCTKAIYSIGFETRAPEVPRINFKNYDINTGIIAPGLFGVGIAFPQQTVSPFGGAELNVGLYKFMKDIRKVMPVWLQYG